MLSGELEVMGDTVSTGKNREYIKNISTGLTRENVENMTKSSIDNRLTSSHRKYIEESIKRYIDSLGISSTGTNDIEEVTRAFIELSLEPIKASVSKLDADTQSQLEAVRDDIEKLTRASTPTLPHKEKTNVDGDNKTWGEFFKMVGIESMTAVEAQKKENIDVRTQQIDRGLQAAREQGLGEWAVKRAGRDFVRVEAYNLDTLPLFPN